MHMGKNRKHSCSEDTKKKCAEDEWCSISAISPRRKDGPRGMTIEERQKSAVQKIRDWNDVAMVRGDPIRRPVKNKNGDFVPAKGRSPRTILAYTCFPKTPNQMRFAEENRDNAYLLSVASKEMCNVYDRWGDVIPGREKYLDADTRRQCISDVIKKGL